MTSVTKRPTDMRGLRDLLRGGLDWIDVLLFVGMVGVLYMVVLKAMPILAINHLVVAVAFAPVVGRRMIFGALDRGVMRTGVLWSVVGILGLLALLLGAGAASVGIWASAVRRRRGRWVGCSSAEACRPSPSAPCSIE